MLLKSIEDFAEGLKSPCMITQQYEYIQNGDSNFEWDHYEIFGRTDDDAGEMTAETRQETAESRYSEDYYNELRGGWNVPHPEVSPAMRAQGDYGPRHWQSVEN